ncbi:hypothetical protein CAOG_07921 [Capsaspora owczarzaki ATCC 30864]|uniref:RRM domain-containing protein n=1 Tax=Capsaspora owczarzaki (strain ATCC 30864) TaxID=595528 RepID=A0A0D2X5H7_CAPO3|nr:hypothetical protein CAOG_07921 [Capsaspora owczarzaki ATCC 30864]KJE97829.1 hypothetical protein CAOG_007921 [Capsaspora owczarzaki ATCC 30864]|eukprot:XP_004343006.1 hypothetical protein CAOG_07921 [Capsaspora owczarzaki ATCC 30864]
MPFGGPLSQGPPAQRRKRHQPKRKYAGEAKREGLRLAAIAAAAPAPIPPTQVQARRLYVGGLPLEVSEHDVQERFKSFGAVKAVQLIRDHETGESRGFAYLDVDYTENSLKKCMSVYANARWKGKLVRVQLAKESVLVRLQREREEAQALKSALKTGGSAAVAKLLRAQAAKLKSPAAAALAKARGAPSRAFKQRAANPRMRIKPPSPLNRVTSKSITIAKFVRPKYGVAQHRPSDIFCSARAIKSLVRQLQLNGLPIMGLASVPFRPPASEEELKTRTKSKGWIAGKYGRMMTIFRIRRRDGQKIIKVNPAKTQHQLKVFKDEELFTAPVIVTEKQRERIVSQQKQVMSSLQAPPPVPAAAPEREELSEVKSRAKEKALKNAQRNIDEDDGDFWDKLRAGKQPAPDQVPAVVAAAAASAAAPIQPTKRGATEPPTAAVDVAPKKAKLWFEDDSDDEDNDARKKQARKAKTPSQPFGEFDSGLSVEPLASHHQGIAASSRDTSKSRVPEDDTQSETRKVRASAWLGSDDEDDDNSHKGLLGNDADEAFGVRKAFEGAKGQEMLQLQRKIGSDPRFRLDDRFAVNFGEASHEQESDDNQDIASQQQDPEEINLQREKDLAMAVLRSIVPQAAPTSKAAFVAAAVASLTPFAGAPAQRSKNYFPDIATIRYDPKRADSQRFELGFGRDEAAEKDENSNRKTKLSTRAGDYDDDDDDDDHDDDRDDDRDNKKTAPQSVSSKAVAPAKSQSAEIENSKGLAALVNNERFVNVKTSLAGLFGAGPATFNLFGGSAATAAAAAASSTTAPSNGNNDTAPGAETFKFGFSAPTSDDADHADQVPDADAEAASFLKAAPVSFFFLHTGTRQDRLLALQRELAQRASLPTNDASAPALATGSKLKQASAQGVPTQVFMKHGDDATIAEQWKAARGNLIKDYKSKRKTSVRRQAKSTLRHGSAAFATTAGVGKRRPNHKAHGRKP